MKVNKMNNKGKSGGRIVLFLIGLSMILPLLGIPHFIFKSFTWGGSIANMVWYIIGKLVFLALMGLCIYLSIVAEE